MRAALGSRTSGRWALRSGSTLCCALLATLALLALVCSSALALETAVTEVSVKADTQSASAVEVADEVAFKATHALASGEGYVKLTAPSGSVFPSNRGEYELLDGSSAALPSSVTVSPGGAGENVVELVVPFAVAAGDKVEVQTFGVKNPTAKNAAATLAVATSSDTAPVSSSLPINTATAVSELAASASTASAGAVDVAYTATFKAATAVSDGNQRNFSEGDGYVRLTAAPGATFSGDTGDYEIIDGANSALAGAIVVNPGGAGENVVDVYLHGFTIAAGDKVEVQAYEVKNPATSSAAKFSLASSSDVTAATQSLTISAATSISELAVGASTTSAGAVDVAYTASFKATTPVSDGNQKWFSEGDGYIRLTAAAGAVFSGDTGDYEIIDGANSTLPLAATVNPGGAGENVVDVYLHGFPLAAGDKVEVQAYEVKNPSSANAGASFSLATSADVTAASKALAIAASTAPTEVAVSASTSSAEAKDVAYTATFKATTTVSDGNQKWFGEGDGYIRLTAPAGSVFSSDSSYYEIIDGANSTVSGLAVVNPGGAGENVVDVYQDHFPLTAGNKVEVQAYGVSNPTAKNAAATFAVSSSADASAASKPFPIGSATAVTGPHSKRSSTGYTEQFTATTSVSGGNAGYFREGPGYIKFVAPSGVTLPSEAGDYRVTIASVEFTAISVAVSGATALVYVYGEPIAAGDEVTLVVSGLSHPPAGEVHLSSSSDVTPVSASTTGGVGLPAVADVTPHSGPPSGGTVVAITGVAFEEVTAVKFGTTAASAYVVNSETSITATAPAGSGTVDVTVTTSEGPSATNSADRFTYVTGPPEYGRCANVGTGKGKLSSSSCTKEKAGGAYEWEPGALKQKLSLSGTVAKFETAAKTKVECKASSGSGEYSGLRELKATVLTFTGCETAGTPCTGEGLPSGELRTPVLEGVLGWEAKAKKKAALELAPIGGSGTVLEGKCAANLLVIRGSVLVAVKTGKAATSIAYKFKASKGKQKPEHFEGGSNDVLELSLGGASFAQAGLTSSITQTSEEAIEISALF